jgi:uncharacterized membrane protein
LVSFLAFASTYNVNEAHKILALMLDLYSKSFDAMKTFVRCEKMIQMVVEYGNKILLHLLMGVFQFLNPNINGLIETTPLMTMTKM